MKIFVYPNIVKPRYLQTAKQVIEKLNEIEGIECFTSEEHSLAMYGNNCLAKEKASDCDLVVSIGGDGTFLRAGSIALKYEKKLCGINVGRLGFLCAIDGNNIGKENPFINLKEEEIDLIYFEKNNEEWIALNDIVISSQSSGHAIELEVESGELKVAFRGDGLIVSTLTGSSAYNKSAGGPLLVNGLKACSITPICPCGENKDTYVSPIDKEIIVRALREDEPAMVYVDGKEAGQIEEEIRIHNYPKKLNVLKK